MSYNGFITKIKDVKKHSNADRLNVGTCFGNQVIVSLETEEGQLGVYFPSDGQLSIEYCDANDLVRRKDEQGNTVGGYLDPNKRNIRAMKLRGEISDGLFMPLKSLESFVDITTLKDGELITTLNGIEICKKYIPVRNGGATGSSQPLIKKEKKIKYPTFSEHIDTKQLMYSLGQINEGDVCYLTLKMHGTSGRTMYSLKEEKVYKKGINKYISKILKRPICNVKKEWAYVSGTRRVVLENYDGGYYGDDNFRKTYHDSFVGKLQKGETVYYEIVGYDSNEKPIMGTVDTKKTNDKEFIKTYGEKMVYSYGCDIGKNDIYIYRMSITNEDGFEVDYPWDLVKLRAEQIGVKTVPELDRFIYTSEEDMLERVNRYVEGQDPVGITHIREGVVVRIEGKEKFKAYKHKGFVFRLLEGIIKNDATAPDIEEEQDLIEKDS